MGSVKLGMGFFWRGAGVVAAGVGAAWLLVGHSMPDIHVVCFVPDSRVFWGLFLNILMKML